MLITNIPLEDLIKTAGKTLRSLSWHSDGRVIAKSGAGARHPRKNYSARTPHEALGKLIEENGEPVLNSKEASTKGGENNG